MKKKCFAGWLLLAAMCAVLPLRGAFAANEEGILLDTDGKRLFACGTALTIRENGSRVSAYDDAGVLLTGEADLKDYCIFGGGQAGGAGQTSITVESGTLNQSIYGGSAAGTWMGDSAVTVMGGAVFGRIFGGNQAGTLQGSTHVTIAGDAFVQQVFGGNADSGAVTGDTVVEVIGGVVGKRLYGGGAGDMASTTVEGTAHMLISGGMVQDHVYGGGQNADVGRAELLLTGGSTRFDVYGGSEGAGETGSVAITLDGTAVGSSLYAGGAGWKDTQATVGDATILIRSGKVLWGVYASGGGNAVLGQSSVTRKADITMLGGTVGGFYGTAHAEKAVLTEGFSLRLAGGQLLREVILGDDGASGMRAAFQTVRFALTPAAAVPQDFAPVLCARIQERLELVFDDMPPSYVLPMEALHETKSVMLTLQNCGSAQGTWAAYDETGRLVTAGGKPLLNDYLADGARYDTVRLQNSYFDWREAQDEPLRARTDELLLDGGTLRVCSGAACELPALMLQNDPLLLVSKRADAVFVLPALTGAARTTMLHWDGNPARDPFEAGVAGGVPMFSAPESTADTALLYENCPGKDYLWGARIQGNAGGEARLLWQVLPADACRCQRFDGAAVLETAVFYLPEGAERVACTLRDTRHGSLAFSQDCEVVGHRGKPLQIHYALQGEGDMATLDGAVLTASETGAVPIEVIATLGGRQAVSAAQVYIVRQPRLEPIRFDDAAGHAGETLRIEVGLLSAGVHAVRCADLSETLPAEAYVAAQEQSAVRLTLSAAYLRTLAPGQHMFLCEVMLGQGAFAQYAFAVEIGEPGKENEVFLSADPAGAVTYGDDVTYIAAFPSGGADAAQFTVDGQVVGTVQPLADGKSASLRLGRAVLTAGEHLVSVVFLKDGGRLSEADIITQVARKVVVVHPQDIRILLGDALPAPQIGYSGLLPGEAITPMQPAEMGFFEPDGLTPLEAVRVGEFPIRFIRAPELDLQTGAARNYRVSLADGMLTVSAPLPPPDEEDGAQEDDDVGESGGTEEDGSGDEGSTPGEDDNASNEPGGSENEGDRPDDDEAQPDAGGDSGATASGGTSPDGVTNPDGSVTFTTRGPQVVCTTYFPNGSIVTTTGTNAATVMLPAGQGPADVYIPMQTRPGAGLVAVLLHPDGTREILKTTRRAENGLRVMLDESAALLLENRAGTYADVQPSDEEATAFVSSRALMTGVEASHFAPDAPMTRAMLWAALARLEGQGATGQAWREAAQGWVRAQGLSDGTAPDDTLTREQLAAMLHRHAGAPQAEDTLGLFADAGSIRPYARKAVSWAAAQGLLRDTRGDLAPQESLTRAQAATVLMCYLETVSSAA